MSENCFYCECPITPINRTRDHLIPKGQKGSNDPLNIVFACWECNALKGNRTPFQFMKSLEMVRQEAARRLKKDMFRYNKIISNTKKWLDGQQGHNHTK